MARSLRSKRRKKNKQVLRDRYKPRYDAALQAIVANMQKETDELMETAGDIDLNEIKITDPDKMEDDTGDAGEDGSSTTEKKTIKLPKVDMAKVHKFLSQRKKRRYSRKCKRVENENSKKKQISSNIPKTHSKPTSSSSKPKIKW